MNDKQTEQAADGMDIALARTQAIGLDMAIKGMNKPPIEEVEIEIGKAIITINDDNSVLITPEYDENELWSEWPFDDHVMQPS